MPLGFNGPDRPYTRTCANRASPERPELATAKDMQVQMVNRLTTPSSDVGDDTIAIFVEPRLPGNRSSSQQQRTRDRPVVVAQLAHRRDMLPWNNQDVMWRCRLDVAKSDDQIVLEDTLTGDLATDDLAEDTVRIRSHVVASNAVITDIVRIDHARTSRS